ncbi:hypothetical protein [Desulfobacula sp.]|uniref:hypothetical protein n=1 Tax=Desulfobacula sp. TaxID=2593537 RepID=UPI00261FCE69|nr:hypothetical protein [Desulfobacula sp.]
MKEEKKIDPLDDFTILYNSGTGTWDLIFFSGDTTQSGSKNQFKKFYFEHYRF